MVGGAGVVNRPCTLRLRLVEAGVAVPGRRKRGVDSKCHAGTGRDVGTPLVGWTAGLALIGPKVE